MPSLQERWKQVEEDVSWFSDWMVKKLWHHRRKGYWMDIPIEEEDLEYYRIRLQQEYWELNDAMELHRRGSISKEEVIKECADVANFAMMIATKISLVDNHEGNVIQ